MKRILISTLILLAGVFTCQAQNVAVKTNALYWATTTPNLGVEAAVSKKSTVQLSYGLNPWKQSGGDQTSARHWMLMPEYRYWFCEAFEGHFVGLHAHGAQFFGGFRSKRYDGWLAGAGLTYGYHWILSPHWNLEASIGLGYARLWYKESPRIPCSKCHEDKTKNYLGPTKAAVSIVYLF